MAFYGKEITVHCMYSNLTVVNKFDEFDQYDFDDIEDELEGEEFPEQPWEQRSFGLKGLDVVDSLEGDELAAPLRDERPRNNVKIPSRLRRSSKNHKWQIAQRHTYDRTHDPRTNRPPTVQVQSTPHRCKCRRASHVLTDQGRPGAKNLPAHNLPGDA